MLRGIGIVLAIVGGFMMYHSYEQSQTIYATVNRVVGNDEVDHWLRIDLIVGFVFALVGAALVFKPTRKPNDTKP